MTRDDLPVDNGREGRAFGMATKRITKPAGKTRSRGGSKTASGAMRKRSRRAVVEHVEAVLDTREMLRKPLENAQHEQFCLGVLSEPSITASALKAGYASGSARQPSAHCGLRDVHQVWNHPMCPSSHSGGFRVS